MTALNLGARVTGWGFVVFLLGSICWTGVGIASAQHNLIVSNGFLSVINLVGIWRWLGRQRAYEDGGTSAKKASRKSAAPTLFTGTGIAGMPVKDATGRPVGRAVESLIECRTGTVSYVVVASGGAAGIAEELRAVPRKDVEFGCEKLKLKLPAIAFQALIPLGDGAWPAEA